jgi:hypothetical protein
VARAATPGYSHRDVRDHESSGQFEHALRPLTEPTVSCVGKGQPWQGGDEGVVGTMIR